MLENNLKCRDKVYHCEELVKIIKIDVLFMYFAAQMKKILNFEINKKTSKVNNKWSTEPHSLTACTHHAQTRADTRRQYQTPSNAIANLKFVHIRNVSAKDGAAKMPAAPCKGFVIYMKTGLTSLGTVLASLAQRNWPDRFRQIFSNTSMLPRAY